MICKRAVCDPLSPAATKAAARPPLQLLPAPRCSCCAVTRFGIAIFIDLANSIGM